MNAIQLVILAYALALLAFAGYWLSLAIEARRPSQRAGPTHDDHAGNAGS
jgi:hypothetical protein